MLSADNPGEHVAICKLNSNRKADFVRGRSGLLSCPAHCSLATPRDCWPGCASFSGPLHRTLPVSVPESAALEQGAVHDVSHTSLLRGEAHASLLYELGTSGQGTPRAAMRPRATVSARHSALPARPLNCGNSAASADFAQFCKLCWAESAREMESPRTSERTARLFNAR